MIKAVKFVTVPSQNQDRSLAFFTEKLGFAVATDQPFSDDQRWIELRIPGAETRLVLFRMDAAVDPDGKMTGISFLTDNVQATYEELAGRGVEFVQEPQDADWGSAAVFRDPEGNVFVLSSK